jgi:hypothetical protein
MKRILCFLTVFLWSAPCVAASASYAPVGVWQHVSFSQTADGEVVRQYDATDRTTLEYRSDGTWSLTGPKFQSSGTYRVMSDDRVTHTTTESNLANQIGYTSVKTLNVVGQTLVIVTQHDAGAMKKFAVRADGTRPRSMKVTSTFKKIR